MSSSPAAARRSRYSRSLPWLPDAMPSRGRSGKRGQGAFLGDDQLLDALEGESEHRVQLASRVRCALRGRLQLDQPAVLRHHAVQVGRRLKIFAVIQVED